MRELWRRRAKGLIEQNLFVCVRQVILSTNDMRNSHLDVIENNRKVVERMTIRAQQHEIFNLGICTFLFAIDDVREPRGAFRRDLQADCKWFVRCRPGVGFVFGQITKRIAAMIDTFRSVSPCPFSDVLLDVGVSALFFRREIAVGFAFVNQAAGRRAMLLGVGRLKDHLLIVVETEPLEPLDDRPGRFVRRSLQVRVFNAQQKLAADFAREQPVEQGRARGADVQIAGW